MKLKSILFSFFFLVFALLVKAENNYLDSLISLTVNEKNDSILVDLYNKIGSESNKNDEQISEEYWRKALGLATKKVKENRTTYFLGQLANANNGLGIISKRRGNLTEAITYYQKSIKINEELHDIDKLSTNYFNIGVIFRNLNELDKALVYYRKSLAYRKEINDTSEIASTYLAIGVLYRRMNDYDKALEYYHKSLDLSAFIKNEEIAAQCYSNMGVIYLETKEFEKASDFFNKAFKINSRGKNQSHIAKHHANMASVYNGLGKNSKAIQEGEIAYQMYTKMSRIVDLSSISKKLSDLYAKTNNHKRAFELFKEHIVLRDTIYNEETTRKITEKEMQFEFDKQTMADSLVRAENEKIKDLKYNQKINQQKTFMYGGGFLFLVVIIFSFIIYQRLKISNKQKSIIEKQKILVEIKNKEVLDSINYAKRIQTAILPSHQVIKESLPNSFIFYQPKDIVAGDFYWFYKKENKILIAVADCTGHGVPGAMVSVVCHNALNRAVNDFNLIEPAKILDKTSELVTNTFKKTDEDVKDGMDISLCCFDLENKKLTYAGATNSLFFISNNNLRVIKGDRQPIGQHENIKPFTSHQLDFNSGDKIYLFSDGYVDQFGGEKGKKFMYKRFRDLLLGISLKEFSQQKNMLEREFIAWRKDLEQVDDICVIGIEV